MTRLTFSQTPHSMQILFNLSIMSLFRTLPDWPQRSFKIWNRQRKAQWFSGWVISSPSSLRYKDNLVRSSHWSSPCRQKRLNFPIPNYQVDAAVLKLHSRRCTCLQFHPTNDNLVISGDKAGQVCYFLLLALLLSKFLNQSDFLWSLFIVTEKVWYSMKAMNLRETAILWWGSKVTRESRFVSELCHIQSITLVYLFLWK